MIYLYKIFYFAWHYAMPKDTMGGSHVQNNFRSPTPKSLPSKKNPDYLHQKKTKRVNQEEKQLEQKKTKNTPTNTSIA